MQNRRTHDEGSALIVLAAGGTGGHMFPAEALAELLVARKLSVLLVTDERGQRFTQDFPDCVEQILVPASRWRQLLVAPKLALAFRRKSVRAVVGFGGYPSLSALAAARLASIPYWLHEQNAVLGRVNRVFARSAQALACGFAGTKLIPEGAKALDIGNPVRAAARSVARPWRAFGNKGAIKIVAFGGSQGASTIAENVPLSLAELPASLRERIHLRLQARKGSESKTEVACAAAGIKAEISEFFSDLPQAMADAHLLICRAGAMTLAEIAAIGRPSILIPYPYATNDHQTANAKSYHESGAAMVIDDHEVSPKILADIIEPLLSDTDALKIMSRKAHALDRPQALAKLANLLEQSLRS